jgi:Mg-chelatase subunit ChlD
MFDGQGEKSKSDQSTLVEYAPDFEEDEELLADFENSSDWDVAVRYHEFKRAFSKKKKNRKLIREAREISARAILARAKSILGSVVHPTVARSAPWREVPPDALYSEIDLDETLENMKQEVWMAFQTPRRQSIILTIDTSLSMTGEKLALTGVALAVVLLQFPEDPVGIIAFENDARILKSPDEKIGIVKLLERFVDFPAQGYTHLEEGLRCSLSLAANSKYWRASESRPPSTVLLTDGKYTAGKDPTYLAKKFFHLSILKMGMERASYDLCKDLARRGRGELNEIDDLNQLPFVMYGVVKNLLRGR